MKKLVLFFLIIGLIFTLGGCNTPTDPNDKDDDITEPTTIEDGGLYVLANSPNYPGAEVNLTDLLPKGETLKDISEYASVTVNATLYSDETGETVAVPASANDNLAQFKLLKATGDWDSDSNICGSTKYNMAVDGSTTMTISSTATGVPAILLLQANWADFPDAVKSIKVNSITFTPKSSGGGSEITVDHVYEINNGTGYLGCQIDLEEWGPFLEISKYASVTIDATLYFAYTDETTNTKATLPEGNNNNLAQFKLLKGSGDWDEASNVCSPTKYSMAVDGPTTLVLPADGTGVPAFLLLQANHVDFSPPNAVTHIKVKSITFTARTSDTSDVVLEMQYNNGDFIEIDGNKITFKNASYSDCGALYRFPESWEATDTNSLKDKTLTFTYSIPTHTCVPAGNPPADAVIEHQIHIQAAHNNEDKYNGSDSSGGQPGQQYIELTNGSGTFTVAANALITASQASNATNGPFVLNAVRIVNNGTKWEDHYRCKSYTLIIESVTK